MIMHRYYLVEAVKRVAAEESLTIADLKKELSFIVSDKRRAQKIMDWIEAENKRPWP